jgi:large subunit ribosomal protein L6
MSTEEATRMGAETERKGIYIEEIPIPKEVRVSLKDQRLVVTGLLGTVEKDFSKIPVSFKMEEDKISFQIFLKGRKGLSLVNTVRRIVENLFIGVVKGFTYRMKVYYRHFPVTVTATKDEVIIKNFTGERGVRRAKIVGETKVTVNGDDIIIKGPSKEDVGITAANIHQVCETKTKDPRIFLDGIYLYERKEGMDDA